MFNPFKLPIVKIQTMAWTANMKKFKLKSNPDTTYLLVTVIKIDDAQYAKIEIGAELAIDTELVFSIFQYFFLIK